MTSNIHVPHEVLGLAISYGYSPMRAWREHLGLSSADVALAMGVLPWNYDQIESSSVQRTQILRRAAMAMGISFEQINF